MITKAVISIYTLEDEIQALVHVPVDFHVHTNMPEHLKRSIEREMVTL